ncbi:adenylate/guanylate cyclase domain-containing protein [Roseobacter sp. A03A-229]
MLTQATDAVASRPAKRLAAIMFADAVDFTAFTSQDEDHAIAVLHDFLTSTAHPLLDKLGADTRKDLGDGLLATFASVETAVRCAENLQAMLAADRAADRPRWKGLRFRIAIHFSDVQYVGDDVFGEGVNLAKRLQEAAATDAVILSHAVCENIRPTRATEIRDLGFVALKGFDRPVRAYDLISGPSSSLRVLRAEEEIPSIAVLPFENLGASESDTYFADGLVEDIIGSLSGLREMVVIARGSTLGFRERHIDPLDARRVLGVRYVLQGTIRRWQGAIRLSATLSDTETGGTMFSTRSDIREDQLFQQQDRIVSEIVTSIAPQVRQAELMRAIRKPPEVFSAYDCLLKALDLMRQLKLERYEEARTFLDQAVADDGNFAAAYCWRAAWWIMMVVQGWAEDRELATSEAEQDAKRAVKLDGSNAQALAILAQTKAFMRGDHEGALALMERARRAGPGNTFVMMISAGMMAYVGRGQDAVMYAEQAHQLVPLDQIPFREFDWLALAHYSAGNYQRAIFWARRALDEQKGHLPSLRLLAASLAADGNITAARDTADILLSAAPDFRLGEYAKAHATFADAALQEGWIEHLRAAGIPD